MFMIKDENFITIQGWMINKLKLKGNELLIFALIYGFTQDGEQWFEGSRKYIAEWCNATKQGIQKNLKTLVEKGLLIKEDVVINEVKFCKYKANPDCLLVDNKVDHGRQQSCPPPSQQSCPPPSQQSCPNNNKLNNNSLNNNNNNIYDENFEKIWKMLKSTPNDRKGNVKPKRKKELYQMGFERIEKAINLYLKIQDPNYYHRRDNFFNNIIDNYLDKKESDFMQPRSASYDINEYEKTSGDPGVYSNFSGRKRKEKSFEEIVAEAYGDGGLGV